MSTPTEKDPGWVTDYLTGIDYESRRRQNAGLESRLPHLTVLFNHLISILPNPDVAANTEFPVAAAIARARDDGSLELVSGATNRTNAKLDSTAHAELEAMKDAQLETGSKHLGGYLLLSTLEPCVMCCGAASNTGVSTVIYGASHDDIRGKHALVAGEYKPHRLSPHSFDADQYLDSVGIEVISGYMRDEVLAKLTRTPVNFGEYYPDPDA